MTRRPARANLLDVRHGCGTGRHAFNTCAATAVRSATTTASFGWAIASIARVGDVAVNRCVAVSGCCKTSTAATGAIATPARIGTATTIPTAITTTSRWTTIARRDVAVYLTTGTTTNLVAGRALTSTCDGHF